MISITSISLLARIPEVISRHALQIRYFSLKPIINVENTHFNSTNLTHVDVICQAFISTFQFSLISYIDINSISYVLIVYLVLGTRQRAWSYSAIASLL